MKRTDVLCPECMKKKLLTTNDDTVNDNRTWCDNCGTDFILNGNSVRYGNEPNNKPITPTQFVDRGLNRLPASEMTRLKAKGWLESSDYGAATDWVMVVSEDARDTKYGRYMYSPSLDKLRGQTMGEFYGGGVVD